jgi:peptidoglycan/xylan/chitin deacetylase (PgdA/CDA1 family)
VNFQPSRPKSLSPVPFLLPSWRALAVIASFFAQVSLGADAGTEVLKWKDGKKAVFLLAFDDGAPSQLKNVIPELEKRKIVGTFYLVTGNTLYEGLKGQWEQAAKSPYVSIANHTFTHKGVTNLEELDTELAKNNEVLYKLHPERKVPRLLGFGKPGGVPWVVSKDELSPALAKHSLVNRPPFYGPPIHLKSAAEMIAAVDTALAKGEMGHLDFHGVGGDWLVTPLEWFLPLLDKLEASRDQLWITDVVSWHQYVTERNGAEVKVTQNDKTGVRLVLSTTADPALYDLPLTLSTKVPAEWNECSIAQGANKTTVPARDGRVVYPALPGGGEITIRPAAARPK